jgi:hypothetical protein
MGDVAGPQAELTSELVEWWEDLWQRGMTSRVVLAAVPPGWGRSTVLNRLAEAVGADDAPVTLIVRIGGRALSDEDVGLQAAGLQDCLAGAVGLGAGGLFISGLAAGVGFLVTGVVLGAAGNAWDDGPAGHDGAVARAARAVAAASAEVPTVVIIDDADWLDQDLALTLIENLAARRDGHILVVAAVNPGGGLEQALVSRSRPWITEGLVQVADADPAMDLQARADLARQQCPGLPEAVVSRIAQSTSTFAEVCAVATAPRLAEIGAGRAGVDAAAAEFDADLAEFEALEAAEAVIGAELRRPDPSPEAVIVAWAGGVLHARQVARARPILGTRPAANTPAGNAPADADVLRWDGLMRLADRRAPRWSAPVAALAARDRQAMAATLLDEALRIAADPECGLVDRVAAARAAHRVRADLPDRGRLARLQRELAAGLETLGEAADALEVAAAALDEWPDGGRPEDRDWLAAAVLRLANARLPPQRLPTQLAPLLSDLITEAVAGGALVGPEARIWAAIDLLAIEGQREAALALIDRVTDVLDQHQDFGAVGDRWRLLLAFHAGRAGYPAIAGRLLGPLLNAADPAQRDDARAVLGAGAEPGAHSRLQNVVLEAELAALPPDADDDRIRIHRALARNHEALGDFRQALIHAQLEVELRQGIQWPSHPDVLAGRRRVAFLTGHCV